MTKREESMLLHLVHSKNDDQFKVVYDAIQRSLWPYDDYLAHVESRLDPKLPVWEFAPVARKRTKLINESLTAIVNHVAKQNKFYTTFTDSGDEGGTFKFPFLERYHHYFLDRQWVTPLRDPQDRYRGLFRLQPLDDNDERHEEIENTNYSMKAGDYNHFMNVIAVVARLIDYFTNHENIIKLLQKPNSDFVESDLEECRKMAEILAYEKIADMRVLRLMLSAYFHDIGKTVVYHRHAMEGASILAGHTSTAYLQLNKIVGSYGKEWEFVRDDLLYISNMVYYHDQFGTLSTGEAGYLRLVGIVDRIKRSSTHIGIDKKDDQIRLSLQHLFDLWLLNLGDIIVSINCKYELQEVWLSRAESERTILSHLRHQKNIGQFAYEDFWLHKPTSTMKTDRLPLIAPALEHDLWIAINLLSLHNESWHSDNLGDLEREASKYASRHVVERITRLVESSLISTVRVKIDKVNEKYGPCDALDILDRLYNLPRDTREKAVLRSIRSVSNFTDFSERFGWIGQMDYALGFFIQIAEQAIDRIVLQLSENGLRTGWIKDEQNEGGLLTHESKTQINAMFLTDNFASTVVQILEYLLFRDQASNQLRNIEFEDASKRLTKEKIDKIIGMEGPYRARTSIESILQTIFVY
jgi:hypothetical protein